MPTIRDVARAAGVSVSSVSKVLNDKPNVSDDVRRRVRHAVGELGYRRNLAARALHTKRTQTLACLVPSIENPFFSSLLRTIEDTAHAHGYGVFVGSTHGDPKRVEAYRERLLEMGIDGVLAAQSWDIVSGDLIATLAEHGIPTVGIAGSRAEPAVDCLVPDDVGGGEAAGRYLLGLGHRRIAFLGAVDSRTTDLRYAGLQRALAAAGVAHGPALLVRGTGYGERDAALAVEELTARQVEFTAIVAFNDIMALGALNALERQGMDVPDWVSLVGFDDTVSAYSRPKMTTVACSKAELGRRAVLRLLERLDGRSGAPEHLSLPMDLIVRASTRRNARAVS